MQIFPKPSDYFPAKIMVDSHVRHLCAGARKVARLLHFAARSRKANATANSRRGAKRIASVNFRQSSSSSICKYGEFKGN